MIIVNIVYLNNKPSHNNNLYYNSNYDYDNHNNDIKGS